MPQRTTFKSQLFSRFVKPVVVILRGTWRRGRIPAETLMVLLAGLIGVGAGLGTVLFTELIGFVGACTVNWANQRRATNGWWWWALIACPPLGLLAVSWFTRRFAREAQGHGVPEVITAIARHDGVIRPRVAIVKILASGVCIGTGGSVGREGPIVQIGSALGSSAGQLVNMSARNIKVLVAAGAAAGISATFNAPIAGVMFASEIILGSFAIESLTPIVIASVLADVVQQHVGEHRFETAFQQLHYEFAGSWRHLPSYLLLGLLCGLMAVLFIKMLYRIEDLSQARLKQWWLRALVLGLGVSCIAATFHRLPPSLSHETSLVVDAGQQLPLPLLGVGYQVVDQALHIQMQPSEDQPAVDVPFVPQGEKFVANKTVLVDRATMWRELLWLLPLFLLKPVVTSLTLAGGGSGGVFAPSLYIGATLGASFGLISSGLFPSFSGDPGVYAIVGMGAVVAGTTHGVLSAILIVYEMTGSYEVILPIMAAAGLSSLVARLIDHDSIYYKKLSRRGEAIARGHDLHRLDHIMVRDVMIRKFPILKHSDNVQEIVRIARANPDIESLPVQGIDGKLAGIIRTEDLHRVLDSEISPHLIYASDIALRSPISVSPRENLIEALRDFGSRDVETLPVEIGTGENRKLVGLLLRADVMRRYRQEMLDGG